MSGILLACALAGSKRKARPINATLPMFMVVRTSTSVRVYAHSDINGITAILPDATGWVNIHAEDAAAALNRALELWSRR